MSTAAITRSINYGQLATATDRLLVLGMPRKRDLARGSSNHIELPTAHTVIVPARRARVRSIGRLPVLGTVIAIGILLGFVTTRYAAPAHAETARLEVR